MHAVMEEIVVGRDDPVRAPVVTYNAVVATTRSACWGRVGSARGAALLHQRDVVAAAGERFVVCSIADAAHPSTAV
jgi:hypothetical protein